MPEQSHAGFQTSDLTAQEFTVPASVLARWAAKAGELASVGYIPTQPSAA